MRRSMAALLIASLLPAMLSAQSDSAAPAHSRTFAQYAWGLGLALGAAGGIDGTPVDIRVPIRAGANWRIEPQLGVYRSTESGTRFDSASAIGGFQVKYRTLHAAITVARLIPVDSTIRFYVGGRIGIRRGTQSQTDTLSANVYAYHNTTTSREFGVITGAEAAVGTRLTLGGEVGAHYVDAPTSVSQTGPSYVSRFDQSAHQVFTEAAIVMRWFPGRS